MTPEQEHKLDRALEAVIRLDENMQAGARKFDDHEQRIRDNERDVTTMKANSRMFAASAGAVGGGAVGLVVAWLSAKLGIHH